MIGKRLQIAIGLLLCSLGIVIGHLINSVYGTMCGTVYVSMSAFLPIIAFLGIVYGAMLRRENHDRDLAFELTVCIGMGLALGIGGAYPNKLKLGLALMGVYYLAVLLTLGMKYARHKWRA